MKIKSPYSNTFGMYCLLPFPSMTVDFDEKHLTFWILGNAFYGTPGRFAMYFICIQFRPIISLSSWQITGYKTVSMQISAANL